MKYLNLNPNFRVRAMVNGAVRSYGVRADGPRLAQCHTEYLLRKAGRNPIVLSVTPIKTVTA